MNIMYSFILTGLEQTILCTCFTLAYIGFGSAWKYVATEAVTMYCWRGDTCVQQREFVDVAIVFFIEVFLNAVIV